MRIPTDDGWTLDVAHVPARGAPRAAVLALHAMMVDRRTLVRPGGLAGHLADAGFDVYAADLRGHGASGPSAAQGGAWTYDDLVRHDVPALLRAVRAAADGLPVLLLGHSLGTHASVTSIGSGAAPAPDGLVLLAGGPWMPSLDPSRRRRLLKHAAMRGFLGVTRARGRFPSRRLGVGPADEARGYVEDLVRFWREDRWASRDGVDYLAAARAVPCPVLAVASAGDRLLAHPDASGRWASHVGHAPEIEVCGRGSGLPLDPGHMAIVTDPRSAPLWDRLVTWKAEIAGRSTTAADA